MITSPTSISAVLWTGDGRNRWNSTTGIPQATRVVACPIPQESPSVAARRRAPLTVAGDECRNGDEVVWIACVPQAEQRRHEQDDQGGLIFRQSGDQLVDPEHRREESHRSPRRVPGCR
jgi:hypothetical protein